MKKQYIAPVCKIYESQYETLMAGSDDGNRYGAKQQDFIVEDTYSEEDEDSYGWVDSESQY